MGTKPGPTSIGFSRNFNILKLIFSTRKISSCQNLENYNYTFYHELIIHVKENSRIVESKGKC